MMHRFFAIVIFALIFVAPFALAEDLPVVPEEAPAIEKPEVVDPFSQDIPDKYISEAAEVQKTCEKGFVKSQYFDCECRALKYLEERVKQGEFAEPSLIIMNIQDECRDSTEAAGQEYLSCFKQYINLVPDNKDPEEFCQCFANTYSDLIDRFKPNVRAKTMVQFRTRALLTCIDPISAQERYGRYLPPKKP